jgi:hypothetical protein
MKVVGYAIGVALVAVGFGGLLAHAADTRPVGWLAWFAGAVVVHDFLFVPVVLLLAALVGRLPVRYRTPVQVAAVLGGTITIVSLPLVLGFGKSAGNPSQLPLDYGRNLILVLAAIAVGTAVVIGRRAWSARVRHRGADSNRRERDGGAVRATRERGPDSRLKTALRVPRGHASRDSGRGFQLRSPEDRGAAAGRAAPSGTYDQAPDAAGGVDRPPGRDQHRGDRAVGRGRRGGDRHGGRAPRG